MKYSIAASTLLALQIQNSAAFAPSTFIKPSAATSTTQRSAVDPSIFADVHQHADTLSSFFSSINLADAADEAVNAATSVAATAAPAVEQASSSGNGWFGFLEAPIEFLLGVIHSSLTGVGMSENSWGVTIIVMVVIIKLATYPLTKQQLTSTNKMQALQPVIKETQAKYQSNPEVMNQKIAEIYQTNEVNPLAGCIPSLLQIPIFIGLYRAVSTLAQADKLNEPFLWLPNLEGPTYGADPAHASEWLLKWVDGAPALGWEDTIAFLTIPVLFAITNGLSMQVQQSKDVEQPAFTKYLPFLFAWFTVNVPAALGVYWVANGIITTALSLQIRSQFDSAPVVSPSSAGPAVDVTPQAFTPAPISEKPAGFGAAERSVDEITPITPMDAEVVSEETTATAAVASKPSKPKRGNKKKKRKGKR